MDPILLFLSREGETYSRWLIKIPFNTHDEILQIVDVAPESYDDTVVNNIMGHGSSWNEGMEGNGD